MFDGFHGTPAFVSTLLCTVQNEVEISVGVPKGQQEVNDKLFELFNERGKIIILRNIKRRYTRYVCQAPNCSSPVTSQAITKNCFQSKGFCMQCNILGRLGVLQGMYRSATTFYLIKHKQSHDN